MRAFLAISRSAAAMVAVVTVSAPRIGHADSVILKNGSMIHGKASMADGHVRVDFGASGHITIPERSVAKIVPNDENDFARAEATPVPAAAARPVVVRLTENGQRYGGGPIVGRTRASSDERVMELELLEGGVVRILKDDVASVTEADEASARPVPAASTEAADRITTTHRIHLRNGEVLAGNVLSNPENGPLELGIGHLGTMKIRRGEIAAVDTVEGVYLLPPPPPEPEALDDRSLDAPPKEAPLDALRREIREQVIREVLESLIEKKIDGSITPLIHELSLDSIEVAPAQAEEIVRYVAELGRHRTRNRVRAERYLKDFGVASLPYLAPALRHPFELTRRAAMRVIRDVGDIRAVPYAISGIVDEDVFVRQHANEALARLLGAKIADSSERPAAARAAARDAYESYWQGLIIDHVVENLAATF
jgi:hypothetical protein